jgi:TonB-dependent SusC/RagA subfamily outer membrane receptor
MKKSVFLLSALACAINPAYAQTGAETIQEEEVGAPTPARERLASPDLLQEVLVIGYSTVEARNITGAVSAVDLSEIEDMPAGNVLQNLQGKVPGLFITTTGNPSSTATVRVRGQGLGPLGNNDPLYVIDGVATTAGMHELNGHDIESIQVLRDASTASIYGSRAANGVIVITTRKGNRDETKFKFSANRSYDQFKYDLNPLTTEQRARAVFQAAVNDRSNPSNASPPSCSPATAASSTIAAFNRKWANAT